MKFRKFIIKNYKAIDMVEVDIKENVIPLIGVNESGKTSILQGILAFDKTKDSMLNGMHIYTKNKYKTSQEKCLLIAMIEIKEDEFGEIGEAANLSMSDDLYAWLDDKIKKREPIALEREYGEDSLTNSYNIVGAPESKKLTKVAKEIVNRLPNILYFDDFSDRVPEEIVFPVDFKDGKNLPRTKIKEWQEIIIEIFERASENGEGLSLEKFMELDDDDDRTNYLSDVTDTLNQEIIDEWKNLKTAYSNLASDSVDLEVVLKYTPHERKFIFKIKDKEAGGKSRQFDVHQRSKGFQWFFNFIMKLKFNPKYKSHPENAIYLLDEPGSYLHSSAQTELLKKLCSISENNTIIYCTHSQYLLDPEIINIGSIKIVSKDEGKIKLDGYGDSKLNKSMGAFSALYDALQLKYGFNASMKKCILTEGITDYYFFKMFLDLPEDINIIPGAGCSNLKDMISILISFSEQFVVVLDNDGGGRQAFGKYKSIFGQEIEEDVYRYDIRGEQDFVLEDILSEQDKTVLMEASGCNDVKMAIPKVYFDRTIEKESMKTGFDRKTQNNLNIIRRKLLSKLQIEP